MGRGEGNISYADSVLGREERPSLQDFDPLAPRGWLKLRELSAVADRTTALIYFLEKTSDSEEREVLKATHLVLQAGESTVSSIKNEAIMQEEEAQNMGSWAKAAASRARVILARDAEVMLALASKSSIRIRKKETIELLSSARNLLLHPTDVLQSQVTGDVKILHPGEWSDATSLAAIYWRVQDLLRLLDDQPEKTMSVVPALLAAGSSSLKRIKGELASELLVCKKEARAELQEQILDISATEERFRMALLQATKASYEPGNKDLIEPVVRWLDGAGAETG